MNRVDTELVLCPYDTAHTIIKSRMLTHLAKCGQNYPNINKISCNFNALHIIPEPEMKYHLENCPDRIKMDRFIYKSDDTKCPVKDVIPIETPEADENWDNELPPVESFLDRLPYDLENKNVLRVSEPVGMSKARRRAFRNNEQMRIKKLQPILEGPQQKLMDESNPGGFVKNQLWNGDESMNKKSGFGRGDSSSLVYSRAASESTRKSLEPAAKSDWVLLGKGMKPRKALVESTPRSGTNLMALPRNEKLRQVDTSANKNQYVFNENGLLDSPIPSRGRGRHLP